MAERLLLLGNRTYSSWSLRAGIGLAMAGVPCTERVIKLFRPETPEEILHWSPSGRVPCLVEPDGLVVHDSLAILEYVNEAYGEGRLWPADPAARARARAVSAEMHAGFAGVRALMPMNLARMPAPLPPEWAPDVATQWELERLRGMWEGLLADSGGPFLFGEWSIADAMYLPMASRLHTYAIDLSAHPRSRDWVHRLLNLPAFQRWETEARREPEEHAPYAR